LLDEDVTHVVLGVTQDGRDVAGLVVGSTGLGFLANADAVTWADGGPVTQASVLSNKAITSSALTGDRGLVSLRPGGVEAEPASAAGSVEARQPAPPL